MALRYFFILLFTVLLFACGDEHSAKQQHEFVRIKGQNFIDPQGRQLILNGINFISKNPDEKYMPPQGIETFQNFKNWGFNCIRLGIIWDGLEPEPGIYNEEYLKEIDKRIEWAAENGLYVFLDMHQDLYGAKFSDGAPHWATLDGEQPHFTGTVWSDSYLISPAVQTAFDNFWENSPASDGIGLQDHYANLWKHVAKRYANNTTIIGYDIMNEPFMGSQAQNVLPLMLEAYANVFVEETGQAPPTSEELQAIWADETSRINALGLIATKEKYAKVVDAVYELSADFERNQLQPFYQKVAHAIREVDTHHILFLNHNYFVNTGVKTALEATKLADGSVDKNVAYAAHGYDLVVDTKAVENPSYERVEFIFERIAESGKRMNMPVLIGEWGALHGKSLNMIKTAQHLVGIIQKYNFSNTYWAYYDDIQKYPYFNSAIIRPFPVSIAGELEKYNYDFVTGKFICEWTENEVSNEPTVLFVPNLKILSENDVVMTPPAEQIIFEYCDKSNAGKLFISPTGQNIKRTIQFSVKPQKQDEISIK